MKNCLIVFLFFLFLYPIQMMAERVELRISYLCGERELEGESYTKAMYMTLDIGQTVSRFYYRDTIDHAKYPISDPRGRKCASYSVFKNYPSEGLLVYSENFIPSGKCFRYEEEMSPLEWTFLKGDTIILGYSCKKAIATFRGRIWTAWYTDDLPYDNGPWKLGGLPGLILFAYDSDLAFIFRGVGISIGDGSPIEEEKLKYVSVTRNRMQELKRLSKEDWSEFMYQVQGMRIISTTQDTDNPVKNKRKACLIEIDE